VIGRALVALALAACGTGDRPGPAPAPSPAPSPSPSPSPSPTPTAPSDPIPPPSPIPTGSRQLLLGLTDGFDSLSVELALYERAAEGAWARVGEPFPAVLGGRGAGWGRGLHGAGAPADQPGPIKREGDGKSPAGVFALGPAFGYAARAVAAARLPYQALGKTWECVDDPASAHYNRVLDAASVERDWSSSETMRRRDELYRWVVEVGHNGGGNRGAAEAGAGSCIFLHVWRDAASGTAGCTAMAQGRLEALLARLDPAADPLYVLLPREAHAALREPWGLPGGAD
jgi:zinc D-Ala-D-Ala dipeptidase